jgi:hypothetical protein
MTSLSCSSFSLSCCSRHKDLWIFSSSSLGRGEVSRREEEMDDLEVLANFKVSRISFTKAAGFLFVAFSRPPLSPSSSSSS